MNVLSNYRSPPPTRATLANGADYANPEDKTDMSANLKINYIELPAADIEAAKSFYGKSFGWTFVDYGPDYCSFNDGSLDGGFFKSDKRSASGTNGAALIVLFAADLEGARGVVSANGGSIMRDIFSFPGGRRFHFSDPNGNELAIWSDK